MYHYTVPALGLSWILLIAVSGCEQFDGRALVPKTDNSNVQYVGLTEKQLKSEVIGRSQHDNEMPALTVSVVQQINDSDILYDKLSDKRLEIERKIREAMKLYQTTGQKIRTQRAELRRHFGNNSVSQSLDLFETNPNAIPAHLRTAYSCWRTLVPDEAKQLAIAEWIDGLQEFGVLEDIDVALKNIENCRQLSRIFLSSKEQDEIDRLLSREASGWKCLADTDRLRLEQQAIDKMKTELTDQDSRVFE